MGKKEGECLELPYYIGFPDRFRFIFQVDSLVSDIADDIISFNEEHLLSKDLTVLLESDNCPLTLTSITLNSELANRGYDKGRINEDGISFLDKGYEPSILRRYRIDDYL